MDKADGPLFSPEETRTIFGTSAVFALRMLGMSMVLPVFTIFANQLYGANHFLSGLALGAYGLTQAATQAGRQVAVLESLIQLGLKLGVQVVAQAIETRMQLEALIRMGCELGQGSLLSPALQPAQAQELGMGY